MSYGYQAPTASDTEIESPGGGRIRDKRDPPKGMLVSVAGYGKKVPLHHAAAAALFAMVSVARLQGFKAPLLLPVSGYRSTARQKSLFANAVKRYGSPEAARKWVAPPGHSAHHSGRAIDLYLGHPINSKHVARMRETAVWRWLRDNATKFGFYPYENEPWHWEYNPPAQGAVAQEAESGDSGTASLRGTSSVLPLSWGGRWPASAGIHVPPAARGAGPLQLVVYFHGHIIPACGTRPARFEKEGMPYYWNTPLFRCLREALEASGRPCVLVAPVLAPIFGTSASGPEKMGNFQQAGQLDRLVDAVLAHLRASGAVGQGATVGSIVLAGHSAGGRPMLGIVGARNRYAARIRECWGFECLYFGTAGWSEWLRGDLQRRFIHFRREATMRTAAGALARLGNFTDIRNGRSHCGIVAQHWRTALDAAGKRAAPGRGAEQEGFLPTVDQIRRWIEYVPRTGAPETKKGIVSKAEVLGYKDHDATFASGKPLHDRVVEVADALGMDPGFLAANLVAENSPSMWTRTSGMVESQLLGIDDWFEENTARYIKRAIASAPSLGFKYSDVSDTGERWDTSSEKPGGKPKPVGLLDATKAITAVAMYIRGQELMMQRIIDNYRKREPNLLASIDALSPEVRLTLLRYMFNAGVGNALKAFRRFSAGEDIPRSGGITRDPKRALRTAVLHMARAVHLSQAVFGKPPYLYWPKPAPKPATP